jgi:hypothetical protein
MGFERGVIVVLMRRPILLVEAVRAWFAMRRRGRVLPSSAYLSWRRATAYGDPMATASAHDLVYYLEWRRQMRVMSKWERVA